MRSTQTTFASALSIANVLRQARAGHTFAVGTIDLASVTHSQDLDVKSFKVVSKKSEANKATVTVTLTARHSARKNSADDIIRYDFVRETGGWKIDDIKGAVDGKPWSIRQLLVNYLKLFRQQPAGMRPAGARS